MKKLILSALCVAALGACSGMNYSTPRMNSSSSGMSSSTSGASSMGATESGGAAGGNRAQTTSGTYTAPGMGSAGAMSR